MKLVTGQSCSVTFKVLNISQTKLNGDLVLDGASCSSRVDYLRVIVEKLIKYLVTLYKYSCLFLREKFLRKPYWTSYSCFAKHGQNILCPTWLVFWLSFEFRWSFLSDTSCLSALVTYSAIYHTRELHISSHKYNLKWRASIIETLGKRINWSLWPQRIREAHGITHLLRASDYSFLTQSGRELAFIKLEFSSKMMTQFYFNRLGEISAGSV